ncbi:hypothetical protein [Psychrobium sp. 1_MG-2023]|uniref:hypothetical protein n=1 Tax=Psychrobium sp. 1_MG-2023 TaxID=3062624 RepID=UPI000C32A37C|nr:hypothetical protein [Psychrobium sp. 1_MG-2023]MDP2561580.1 hypothetical protein [Psychrobium sp. 1_MG-2023]PKF55040.1 hypothetical protein CW748_14785 [Alteromonadales bacterium alter-6D02]
MTQINPLVAGAEIALARSSSNSAADQHITQNRAGLPKPDLGEFKKEVVQVTQLAREKQQQEQGLQALSQDKPQANEAIRVSSSLGKSQSVGQLTETQAIKIYKQIANILT